MAVPKDMQMWTGNLFVFVEYANCGAAAAGGGGGGGVSSFIYVGAERHIQCFLLSLSLSLLIEIDTVYPQAKVPQTRRSTCVW
jgi:hypothetical protein